MTRNVKLVSKTKGGDMVTTCCPLTEEEHDEFCAWLESLKGSYQVAEWMTYENPVGDDYKVVIHNIDTGEEREEWRTAD